jgi:hypothetical protein
MAARPCIRGGWCRGATYHETRIVGIGPSVAGAATAKLAKLVRLLPAVAALFVGG